MWLSGESHWNLNNIKSINHLPSKKVRQAGLKYSRFDWWLLYPPLGWLPRGLAWGSSTLDDLWHREGCICADVRTGSRYGIKSHASAASKPSQWTLVQPDTASNCLQGSSERFTKNLKVDDFVFSWFSKFRCYYLKYICICFLKWRNFHCKTFAKRIQNISSFEHMIIFLTYFMFPNFYYYKCHCNV